jgi:hypothetical protein
VFTTNPDGTLGEQTNRCPCGRELNHTLGLGRQRGPLGLAV